MMSEQQIYSVSEVLNALRMRLKHEVFASVWLNEWFHFKIERLECFEIDSEGQWNSILRWEKKLSKPADLKTQKAHLTAVMQHVIKQAEIYIGDSEQIYSKTIPTPMKSILLPVLSEKEVSGLIIADPWSVSENETNSFFLESLASLWGLHRASLTTTEMLESARFERDNLRAQLEQSLIGVTPGANQDEFAQTMLTIARSLTQTMLSSIDGPEKIKDMDTVLSLPKETFIKEKIESLASQDNAESDISSVLDEVLDFVRNDEIFIKKHFIIDYKRQEREIVSFDFKRLQQFISSALSLMVGYGKENSIIEVEFTPHGEFVKIVLKVESDKELPNKVSDFYSFTARLNGWECEFFVQGSKLHCILSLKRFMRSDDAVNVAQSSADSKNETRLLIVDDDESLRELMMDILESRNYEVVCCPDASSAMEQINSLRYDMIITDLGLPNISGSELAAQIKALNPQLPVMMMTGWNIDADRPDARTTHVDFILPKPFNLNELLEKVENGLQASRTMRRP